jgi:hypothetical protein
LLISPSFPSFDSSCIVDDEVPLRDFFRMNATSWSMWTYSLGLPLARPIFFVYTRAHSVQVYIGTPIKILKKRALLEESYLEQHGNNLSTYIVSCRWVTMHGIRWKLLLDYDCQSKIINLIWY